MSSINRILRNRAAERAAAEFARAAGYGLYSAVSAAAGGGVSAPSYPFPWGAPLHPHWAPGAAAPGLTPPSVGHLSAMPTPPVAASSPNRPQVQQLSGSESASPLASPHHPQGLGSLPAGFAAFAAIAAAAAAREANANSATPHGSAADSVQESVSPATSPRGRPSSHGK